MSKDKWKLLCLLFKYFYTSSLLGRSFFPTVILLAFRDIRDLVQPHVSALSNSNFKHEKFVVVVHVVQTTQNLAISRPFFAEDGNEIYQDG